MTTTTATRMTESQINGFDSEIRAMIPALVRPIGINCAAPDLVLARAEDFGPMTRFYYRLYSRQVQADVERGSIRQIAVSNIGVGKGFAVL